MVIFGDPVLVPNDIFDNFYSCYQNICISRVFLVKTIFRIFFNVGNQIDPSLGKFNELIKWRIEFELKFDELKNIRIEFLLKCDELK